jgi:HCOMODA/2-hydroxy-3-carboxy-muconic semialdehyde decarboxylase
MSSFTRAIKDLAIANRILDNLGIVDAFGDISVRDPADPARFLLARSRSPGAVVPEDILTFALDGTPLDQGAQPLPSERFMHAAVYEARSDVKAVLHASPEDILPFGITQTPLRPMIASVGDMGMHVPVWDIADRFGTRTGLQVTTLEQGRDLARCLGPNRVVLLRGEGFLVTGRTLNDVVRISVYIPRNGRTMVRTAPFPGPHIGLAAGESEARLKLDPESPALRRGWEYWAKQAGCDELLRD